MFVGHKQGKQKKEECLVLHPVLSQLKLLQDLS